MRPSHRAGEPCRGLTHPGAAATVITERERVGAGQLDSLSMTTDDVHPVSLTLPPCGGEGEKPTNKGSSGGSRLWRRAVTVLLLLLLFGFYAHFRQRYVGGCDFYGYYAEAQLFLQGHLDMPLKIDLNRYPCAAPLSYVALDGRAVPQYPPGFPLLLAAGMLAGTELFVPPLCAALSVWLLYLMLARRVSRFTAVVFSLMWAFFPIVLAGAGCIMSDLPAALAVMVCYHLLDREKHVPAGLAFAFAVAIRPTNALFGLILLPLFREWRSLVRFAVPASLGGALYGLYNWSLFGAPWRTGYGNATLTLEAGVFQHHFFYYGREILARATPFLLLPAIWAVARRRSRAVLLLLWFLLFWVFYSFWAPGADAWWYTRFLLPGFPALFLLAADGWEDIRGTLARSRPGWATGARVVTALVAAGLIVFSIHFSTQHQCLTTDNGKPYYAVARSAGKVIPSGALVGASETSGSLRLYAGFETFWVLYTGSEALIADTLASGRAVFLVVEPVIRDHPKIVAILDAYATGPQVPLPGWGDAFAVQLLGRKPVTLKSR